MSSRSVILLDFDNVFLGTWQVDRDLAMRFGNEPMEWLPLLAGRHLLTDDRRWLVARCYLNPAGWVPLSDNASDRCWFSRFRPGLVRAGFELVDCPVMTSGGKNAADIRLVIDALDLLKAECRYDEFVIASGDSDFAPLLQRLRAHDRRITVVSPGYASAAYTSLADQTLGLAALEALLRPAPGGDVDRGDAPATGAEPDLQAFAAFVRTRYEDAPGPINLASLAQNVLRAFPAAREQGWYGQGSFSAAVAHVDLPNANLSHQWLWDAERHEPPPGAASPGDRPELPSVIATLARTIDLPRLGRETWPAVFAAIERYAATHQFNLTEATRWPRDELARLGIAVGRPALGYVVRGTQFGSAPLNADPPPTAGEIAAGFYRSVIERARLTGVDLNAEAEAEIADWLGAPPPASANGP